jgi:predicted transcriptional regulator
MTRLTIQVPDTLLSRLQVLAQEQDLSLDAVVLEALESYADDDEATKEEIVQGIKENLKAALAGEGQDAFKVIAELRRELADDAD